MGLLTGQPANSHECARCGAGFLKMSDLSILIRRPGTTARVARGLPDTENGSLCGRHRMHESNSSVPRRWSGGPERPRYRSIQMHVLNKWTMRIRVPSSVHAWQEIPLDSLHHVSRSSPPRRRKEALPKDHSECCRSARTACLYLARWLSLNRLGSAGLSDVCCPLHKKNRVLISSFPVPWKAYRCSPEELMAVVHAADSRSHPGLRWRPLASVYDIDIFLVGKLGRSTLLRTETRV